MELRVNFDKDFEKKFKGIPNAMREIEALDDNSLDFAQRFRDYHSPAKMTGEENANVGRSKHPSHRHGKVYEPLEKLKSYEMLYTRMKEKYGIERADEALEEALAGSLGVHDSENIDLPYCIAYSSSYLMRDGRSYHTDVPNSAPSSARSYINMTVESMYDACSLHMGASVVFDLLIGMAYYTKAERDVRLEAFGSLDLETAQKVLASEMVTIKRDYKEALEMVRTNTSTTEEVVNYVYDFQVTNLLQAYVHLMGNKFRKSYQSIFTNLSLFSPRILKDNFDYYTYPNGDGIVGYIDEICRLELLFAQFFGKGIKGKYGHKVVAMPVVTLAIPGDEQGAEELQEADDKFAREVLDHFYKYNNINVYRGLKLALCCRLLTEKHEHRVEVNSLGVVSASNGNQAVGSLRVVTAGLPSIVKELDLSKSIADRLKEYEALFINKMELARDILETQREIIYDRDADDFYNFSKVGWVDYSTLASTLGGVGVFEAVKLLSDGDFSKPYTDAELEVAQFVIDLFDQMCERFTDETGNSYNMEVSIPAESMAFRFKDREDLRFGEDDRYKELSNQFTPLTLDVDLVDKLQAENYLSSKVAPTGICHINVQGRINKEQNYKLHKTIWEKYPNIEHYAINMPINECENGHLEPDVNANGRCIICDGEIVSTTSRSIGYFKDVLSSFGVRKAAEFFRRVFKRVN